MQLALLVSFCKNSKTICFKLGPSQETKRVAQILVYDTVNNRTLVVLTDLASGKIFLSKFVKVIPPLELWQVLYQKCLKL